MNHRLLLAIALLGLLVALLLAVIRGGRGGEQPSRGELAPIGAEPAPVELAPSIDEPRAPAPAAEAGAPEVPESEARAAVDPAQGLPFRGRVVDVRTGEPVPSAIAKARGFEGVAEAPTDAEGRFSSSARLLPDFQEIAFFNAHDPCHIRTATRAELAEDPGGWLARIRIGPTFRLRIVGAELAAGDRWLLRVVESAPGSPDTATAWLRVVPGEPPWARFDNPLPEPQEGSRFVVEVQDEESTLRGSAPIQSIVGIHPGVVTVELDRRFARVHGRVVDSAGKPLSRALVTAIPRLGGAGEDGSWPGCSTDGAGQYAIGVLAPGRYWLHARPRRGEEPQTIEIELPLGDTEAPDLVAPAERSAGAIEGRLIAPDGADFAVACVRLRAVDGRAFEHFDVVDVRRQEAQEIRVLGRHVAPEPKGFFEFQQVPEGEYELTVLSTDGSRWSPNPLRVSPPRLDLEILRGDPEGAWRPGFTIAWPDPSQPGDRVHIQFLVDGLELESAPETIAAGSRVRWNVSAPGYRTVSGTERDFEPQGTDWRIAKVRMERGFGLRLVLRDAQGRFDLAEGDWAGRVAAGERPPVAGAVVRFDGEVVARSDADGVAEAESAEPPERIEIAAPGWTVLGSKDFREGRLTGPAREVVVWLTR